MQTIQIINLIISILFTVCYSYQMFYLVLHFIIKPQKFTKTKFHNFAVLICARNEELVIGNLINSIKKQTYPLKLIHIFVVADNCTDKTATIAKKSGAIVFERFNQNQIGKGYALNFLLDKIQEKYKRKKFDGYFVFDADNIVDPQFVENMNKTFSNGYDVVSSYRNSKNYGESWLSAGNGLWYLRDSEFMNDVRMKIGCSCAISGTGFLFSQSILDQIGNWNFFTLVEDIEFTAYCITHNIKIGYCSEAMIYDEQTATLSQSWRQRMRWTKGYIIVYKLYGFDLFKGFFKGNIKQRFSCYDMTMSNIPAFFLSIISVIVNLIAIIISFILKQGILISLMSSLKLLVNAYLVIFLIGLITTICEWKNIYTSTFKKIFYIFTLPLYMATFIPISFAAIFTHVSWKPINHTHNLELKDIIKQK